MANVQLLVLLASQILAVSAVGICTLDVCKCDGHNRIVCGCTRDYEGISINEASFESVPEATHLEIRDCSRLFIAENAIKNLKELKRVRLANIADLVLSENSLNWLPDYKYAYEMQHGVQLSIENSTMYELPSHAIKGRIDELNLDTIRVDNLKSFAVSTITDTKVIFVKNCIVRHVETQPFKNFYVDNLVIRNNSFDELPSRTLSDVTVNNQLILESNTINKMRSNCIISNGMTSVHINHNNINTIDSEAFKMTLKGDVLMYNNILYDLKPKVFVSITVLDEIKNRYEKKDFRFVNNTVTHLTLSSMETDTNSFNFIVKEMKFNESCGCSNVNLLLFSKTIDELYCRNLNGSFYSVSQFEKSTCGSVDFSIAILAITIVFSIMLIIAIILSLIYVIRRFCKGERSIFFKKQKPDIPIVKPDGRTYKETELYVVVEKADLLTTDF